ncbi:anaerobic ribonucleoside-triphosphate reductase-activating protein [Photobacterium sp. 2_MG-2023]|uniref:anaerobic ribonucleoside-triphosphate reductase-activating protein n=1 Tax=Photobacterium sp. 2_MG-2023 TaxID=3062663 RepID=UPI0026E36162|nr:anaerobic ribonucleoside-triphosphate reductase-activating protein [Photobacterium sp. 2_MG-2023]MDO6583294.1 anaerobic ribonucleoside-triphosphate reductase-activating protein [Photobacterium sp. 2_MG-2023]
MNFHQYYNCDVVNGSGTRCTLFVSGCEHQCRGCYNQATWPVSSGRYFDQKMEDAIIADLQDTRILRRGLSLSGGDPLHPANLGSISQLVKRVRQECPDKDIWLWTGYLMENLTAEQRRVTSYIDVMIDGPFIQALHHASLIWRGSSNQRVLRKAGPSGVWVEMNNYQQLGY